jgi:hypothetical protein
MYTASTGGRVRSRSSLNGRVNLPKGLTNKSEDEDFNIALHILIDNELTGTGNTAHLPRPLKAAAVACC